MLCRRNEQLRESTERPKAPVGEKFEKIKVPELSAPDADKSVTFSPDHPMVEGLHRPLQDDQRTASTVEVRDSRKSVDM